MLPETDYEVGKLVTGAFGDVTLADTEGCPYIEVMQTEALDRYTFPALTNLCDDATVGQFRGQRCNEYGEKAGDIRLFQMVYTEVHEVKVRGVDDADADDDADVDPPAPEPKELATALALAPRGLESQISASAAAKAKTAQSKERINAADPVQQAPRRSSVAS